MPVATFRIVATLNQSSKKSVLNALFVTRDKWLNGNPRRIACSTDVHGTQTVTLLLGINQLAGHVERRRLSS